MFGTWKYDPETDEVQNLRQAFDPITARSSQHQACDRCHEKKVRCIPPRFARPHHNAAPSRPTQHPIHVFPEETPANALHQLKCSGDKEGCERCIANQLQCVYTRSSSSSRRDRKNRRRSGEGTGRDISPASNPRTRSRARGSQSGHLTPRGGESPLPISTAGSTSQVPAGMMDQLDFSLLTPFDALDLDHIPQSDQMAHRSSSIAATCGYSVPMTLSPTSMSPTFQQDHFSQHQQHPSGFHDPWSSTPHYAPSFTPGTSSPPGAYPILEAAEQGPPGSHGQDYHFFQQHHSQSFYDQQHHSGDFSDSPY